MRFDDVRRTWVDAGFLQDRHQRLTEAFEILHGEPGDYAGSDLLTEWYRRNIHIFNNVTKLVASPDDRILVIVSAGHLGWLRQDFASDPTLRLRKLEEFATPTH